MNSVFHASLTVRQCDPDLGWQHLPSVIGQMKTFLWHLTTLPSLCLPAPLWPVPASTSSPSLPCPALPPYRHLSTHFPNPDTHAHPVDHGEEGRGFRKNKLPFLTINTTIPCRHYCRVVDWEAGDRKERGRQGGNDKDKYSPLVSLLKSKASTIKV